MNRDFSFRHPVLLQPNASAFILPTVTDGTGAKVQLFAGMKARLVCAGNRLALADVQEVEITCVSGDRFHVNPSLGERRFKDLRCTDYPVPQARRTGRKCLGSKYTEVEIGFSTAQGFVRSILVCYDPQLMDSVYSTYNLTAYIGNNQYNVPRPDGFVEGDFYPGLKPRPSALYTRNSQRTALTKILGSKQLAAKYIDSNGDYFMSRGHLTAKADFVYGSQQRATFFYVNVAPQWQTFNGNNWNELEISCRRFADKSGRNLVVYTGVHGHAQLPDEQGNMRALYLYAGNDGKRKLTVPDVFWKVLHDPVAKTAIAFVGHNNPYDTSVAKRALCTNICDKVNWLSWDARNITAGYSYCCDVTELQRVVKQIPDITVHGLLF